METTKHEQVAMICKEVAKATGFGAATLLSPSYRPKTTKIIELRRLAVYLCHKVLPIANSELGRIFGQGQSETILALRKTQERCEWDADFAAMVNDLTVRTHAASLEIVLRLTP